VEAGRPDPAPKVCGDFSASMWEVLACDAVWNPAVSVASTLTISCRKMRVSSITIICLAALLPAPLSLAQREFTSNDGKKLKAEITSASETEVRLKRTKDGKDFTIPLARLSEEDQKFVGKWIAKKKLNTRPERKLTLSLDSGETKIVEVPKGKYLTEDGILTLYPGDTIHLEFDEQKEIGGKPHIVSKVIDPKRTITFSMSHKKGLTMLIRKSKMQETVAMDCTHRGLGVDKFSRTNLRPTEKGLAAYDSWPDTVWTIRLFNFDVTDRPASEVYLERVSK